MSDNVRTVLSQIIQSAVGPDALPGPIDATTPLLGAIPELDSMALLAILTQIEERFGLAIPDDEIGGELFADVGTLESFVRARLDAGR